MENCERFIKLTGSMGGWCVFKKYEDRHFPTLKSIGYRTEQEAMDDMKRQIKYGHNND